MYFGDIMNRQMKLPGIGLWCNIVIFLFLLSAFPDFVATNGVSPKFLIKVKRRFNERVGRRRSAFTLPIRPTLH